MGSYSGETVRARRGAAVSIAALALLTAACGGSTLNPKDVAAANASALGSTGTNAVVGAGSTTSVEPGSVIATSGGTGSGTVTNQGTSNRPGSAVTSPNVGTSHPTVGGTAAPATGQGVKAGSCAGFKNTTGITNSTINLATIADVSGPVPGIFKPAIDATKAYAAYFNSTSTICGRKLAIDAIDAQTNGGGDQVGSQKACDNDFAAVGSVTAFDDGGAGTAAGCGLPDLRALSTTTTRASCATCFGAEAPGGGYYQGAIPNYFTKTDKAATQNAAFIYVGVTASIAAAEGEIRAQKRAGWKFGYTSPFDIAEFNYTPYVTRMKTAGVRLVEFLGSSNEAIGLASAMEQSNFKPDIFLVGGTQYDKQFAQAGSAVEGAVLYLDFVPFAEVASSPEESLYFRWLQQITPGAQPTYFGLFAWSAARLFVQEATELGGQLTRANVVKRLRAVHNWTSNGLHAPQDVGGKVIGKCWRFLQLKGSTWVPYGPPTYICGPGYSSR
jgi:ABC-type branched-subunit amino acid transport system substrate-binding protein